jgi:ribonuclease HII
MGIEPLLVMVDGCHEIPGLPFAQEAVIGGDALEPSISAASILAKTYRDDVMVEYARRFPQYGFEKHKGYATREHLTNLFIHGPCFIHRKSFRPVSSFFTRLT